MTYTIIHEKVTDTSMPDGYYYAHIPIFDLTTHGLGIEGAKQAAKELIHVWIEEKRANGEEIPVKEDTLISKIVIEDAILG